MIKLHKKSYPPCPNAAMPCYIKMFDHEGGARAKSRARTTIFARVLAGSRARAGAAICAKTSAIFKMDLTPK